MEVKGRKSISQKGQSTTSEAAEKSGKTADCRWLQRQRDLVVLVELAKGREEDRR